MGEVYRARDPGIGRDVAIKVLPSSTADDPERLLRFQQEARAAGALNHPNLLTIFDLGDENGAPYIVSELLEGSTLRDALRSGTPLPARKIVDIGAGIAAGLAAAHDKGVIHRDLKPENIFIGLDGRVKLLDFGLAKLSTTLTPDSTSSPTLQFATTPGVTLGTIGYMSPEQVRGEVVDTRSDIFSLGVVLYEMASGAQPFRRQSSVETMNAILKEEAAPLAGIPLGLQRIVLHALEKDPARRFQTARDIGFALEMLSGSGETPSVSGSAAPVAKRSLPAYTRVTFRRGFIMSARFAPDGSIIYGARWEDRPLEIFFSHIDNPESRPLGFPDADILAVSPTGELAISIGRRFRFGWESSGTLARVPMMGGTPREIAEDVQEAEWARDGKNLMIVRRHRDLCRIEYPIDNVVYESGNWLNNARLSPKGDLIAFIEHPLWGDDGGFLHVVDLQGKTRVRPQEAWVSTTGLAWSPDGEEVFLTAMGKGAGRDLLGYSVRGEKRDVLPLPGRLTLYDISKTGALLVGFDNGRREVMVGHPGDAQERNLSWFDWSFVTDLSRDGKRIVFEEQGAAKKEGAVKFYMRKTDGTPAVQLGEGGLPCFSPDGKWVLCITGDDNHLELVPTGVGSNRVVPTSDIGEKNWLYWTPDGKRAVIYSKPKAEGFRLFALPLPDGGEAKAFTPEGIGWPSAISPDSRMVAAVSPDDRITLYPIDGGEAKVVESSRAGDRPIQFTEDGKALFVYQSGRVSLSIDRIDLESGERKTWHPIEPADPAGILDVMPVYVTPDGKSYAYGYRRLLADLFVIENAL